MSVRVSVCARVRVCECMCVRVYQGMSLDVLAPCEQLAADVAAEGAHAGVDDQVPLERAPVLGDVVTVRTLELVEGQVRGLTCKQRGGGDTQTLSMRMLQKHF